MDEDDLKRRVAKYQAEKREREFVDVVLTICLVVGFGLLAGVLMGAAYIEIRTWFFY